MGLWSSVPHLRGAQTHNSPIPSVINSTYAIRIPIMGETTVHLFEREGQLCQHQKWGKGAGLSEAVTYKKINYIMIEADSPTPTGKKRMLNIEDSTGNALILTLPTEEQASAVARYLLRKSSLHLEFIAGAWQVRRTFQCLEGYPGCQDFKELLDHDDPDISEFFYSRHPGTRKYVCFSNAERQFFTISYSHFPHTSKGLFFWTLFRDGQFEVTIPGYIQWGAFGVGRISIEQRHGKAEPVRLGSVDSASLSYRTEFLNRMNTTTEEELSIRWSTERYTETFSSKDEKGKPTWTDSTGVCVKVR